MKKGADILIDDKKCALCKKEKGLRKSHIVPKFFSNYIKNNFSSNRMRESSEVNIPIQDGVKTKLLCSECEELFSEYETYFSKEYFNKVKIDFPNKKIDKDLEILYEYGKKSFLSQVKCTKELYNFVLSIFWRYIIVNKENLYKILYLEEKNEIENFLKLTEEHFLCNERFEDLSKYKLHIIENKHLLNLTIFPCQKEFIHMLFGEIGFYRCVYPNNEIKFNYLRYTLVVPYFTFVLEIIPNEENIIFRNTEIKLEKKVMGDKVVLPEDLITNIVCCFQKERNAGIKALSENQKESILKRMI